MHGIRSSYGNNIMLCNYGFILGCVLLLISVPLMGQTSVMSFNIRYDNSDDSINQWNDRRMEVVKMLKHYSPEIIGIQEGLIGQINYLDSTLVNYQYVGVGRENGEQEGEFTAIFYDTIRFELLETKTYWLSETPDSVSIGWDAILERIVTYGLLIDKTTKEKLNVFNCHFDHVGEVARKKSAELILSILESRGLTTSKVLILGDLNCQAMDEPIVVFQRVLKDAYQVSRIEPYGPLGTYNGFHLNKEIEHRIDFIFINNLNVLTYRHIDDRRENNLYLSDHLPILITVH